MKKMAFFPVFGGATILVAWALTGAGCNTNDGPRDLMMEEANARTPERPVAMKGEGTFFEGKLTAVATVARGFARPGGAGGDGKGGGKWKKNESSGRNPHAYVQDEFWADAYPMGGEMDEKKQKEVYEDYMRQAKARVAAGSPMPPVTLRLQFENHGKEPIELEVTEVNSDLGNFAARPSKITIAPGEKGTLDPMISQLGVSSDEIPLKVGVRVAGKKEALVVPVKNVIAVSIRKEFEGKRQ